MSQLKNSLILLVFLGLLFSIPIVTVGYSMHGPDLALLAALAVIVLVFIGPLSFFCQPHRNGFGTYTNCNIWCGSIYFLG